MPLQDDRAELWNLFWGDDSSYRCNSLGLLLGLI